VNFCYLIQPFRHKKFLGTCSSVERVRTTQTQVGHPCSSEIHPRLMAKMRLQSNRGFR